MREDSRTTLRKFIADIWGCDSICIRKPTPHQESAGGYAVIELVLLDAVPAYLHNLDGQCWASLGRALPADSNPI